ncbi:hypothetical protein [Streptomyces litchfieldiae]|uniref:Uncharacterized protein n=1 Tax=Streptomyces litchfieldiae TaxID=3075543 RepID=A0ABU2MT55_9ACTN|nr:hypothetical protein [Streptomyces sp. DSM 44938]MDT0344715.1 hypothetical protein [Streptomyces sp. DSM 44938]
MNVDAAVALVSAAAGSAATEAGRHAWESLLSLARRLTGRAEPEPVDPADETAVRELTGRIADRARDDADFAAELTGWAERHRAALTITQTRVENTVSGNAQVRNVIQTGTIEGDIRFG